MKPKAKPPYALQHAWEKKMRKAGFKKAAVWVHRQDRKELLAFAANLRAERLATQTTNKEEQTP